MAHYTLETLQSMGFKHLGVDPKIDDSVKFFGAKNIHIGDHVRIDAYTILSASGGLHIGDHVHISCHVTVLGQGYVEIGDFCGLSTKSSIFSSNDDYSGRFLTGPTVPDKYKNVYTAPVTLGKHVVIGASSVVLPGVTFGEGSATGSMALIKHDVPDFSIVVGQPARVVKQRDRTMLEMEAKLRLEEASS